MEEEKHVIVDVSTPKDKEEADKLIKAGVVSQLYLELLGKIVFVVTCTGMFAFDLKNNVYIFYTILGGLSTVISSISVYKTVSDISKYKRSLDSSTSNIEIESEGKTR